VSRPSIKRRLSDLLGGEWTYTQADANEWRGDIDGVPVLIEHAHRDGGWWYATATIPARGMLDLGHEDNLPALLIGLVSWRVERWQAKGQL